MTFIHLSKRGFNKVGHTIISLKPRDFEALIDLKNVVNSASPAQATPMQSLNVYGSMDRVLQKNNEYAVGISMYSQRVGNYEFGNTENKKAGIQQTACFIYTIKTLLSLMKDTGQRSIHIDYQERQLTQENWQMVLIQGNAVPSHG